MPLVTCFEQQIRAKTCQVWSYRELLIIKRHFVAETKLPYMRASAAKPNMRGYMTTLAESRFSHLSQTCYARKHSVAESAILWYNSNTQTTDATSLGEAVTSITAQSSAYLPLNEGLKPKLCSKTSDSERELGSKVDFSSIIGIPSAQIRTFVLDFAL